MSVVFPDPSIVTPPPAQGRIVSAADLDVFLRGGNGAIVSEGDDTSEPDQVRRQQAIDYAEGTITAELAPYFVTPLTIGGQLPRLATGDPTQAVLLSVALLLVAAWMSEWQRSQRVPGAQIPSDGWRNQALARLADIARWARTGSGLAVPGLDRPPAPVITPTAPTAGPW